MNSKLLDYITACRVSGATDERIREELLKVGWKPADIEDALKGAGTVPFPAASSAAESPGRDLKIFERKKSSPVKAVLIMILVLLLTGGAVFGFFLLDKRMGWGITTKETGELVPVEQAPAGTTGEDENLIAIEKGIARCDALDLLGVQIYQDTLDDYAKIECFSEVFEGDYDEELCLRSYSWYLCRAGMAVSEKDESKCRLEQEGGSFLDSGKTAEKCDIAVFVAKEGENPDEKIAKCGSDKYCFSYLFKENSDIAATSCEKISGEGKDKCYFGAALAEEDETFCGKIKTAADRDDCYLSAAIAKGDEKICLKLSSNSFKEKCYLGIFVTGMRSSDFCSKTLGQASCLELSEEMEDPDLSCLAEKWDNYYYLGYPNPACFTSAIEREEESFCEKIGDQEKRNLCYNIVAFLKLDKDVCARIDNSDGRDNCYLYLAKLKADESICEESGGQADSCYASLAVIKENFSLCAKAAGLQSDCEKAFEEVQP